MTTVTSGLTAFLNARIDEDLQEAADDRFRMEAEAKRRIVNLFESIPDPHAPGKNCYDCGVLYALALPYSDHPDYKEEWRI